MSEGIRIMGCHHVALRCKDAKETVDFYTRILGMKFNIATREQVYRGNPVDYLHVFLEMQDGNYLAFFEVPSLKPHREYDADDWTQHFAYRVSDNGTVLATKARLEGEGFKVEGPVVRPPFSSIYFRDPNGHRMEVTALDDKDQGRYRPDVGRANQILGDWVADKSRGALKTVP